MSDRKPAALAIAVVVLIAIAALAGTSTGSLTFTNTPLLLPSGSSENEIAINADGFMAMASLGWLFPFGTNLWTGDFGTTPTSQGILDGSLLRPGKITFGGGDADVDLGSTGTLHATTLVIPVNKPFTGIQISVSAITCVHAASASFSIASNCTAQIIDIASNDRPWVTSDGSTVYISYHDSGNSSIVHVQRSDDDGFTWKRVADPITGQGPITGISTFNNIAGPIKADPVTHNVYLIFAAGETGFLKGRTFTPNNVIVSRSSDAGRQWTAVVVHHDPPGTSDAHVFPALAVDQSNGALYAVWSNGTASSFSASTDQGATWSSAVGVNTAPANTAIFPWVAARGGTVDLVYYGTTGANDSSAVWNVYLAQTTDNGSSFSQSLVSDKSNHTGVICVNGTGCAPGTRNLLDLFEVAINPQNGLAAIVYTNDVLTKDSKGNPLPQTVLAQQE